MQEQLANLVLSKNLLIVVVDLHTQVQNTGVLLWDAVSFLVRCFEAVVSPHRKCSGKCCGPGEGSVWSQPDADQSFWTP